MCFGNMCNQMNPNNMCNQMGINNMCNQMGGMNNMCNNLNIGNQMGNNMNSNMFNNTNLVSMMSQVNNMNQMIFNQIMQNYQTMQNMQNTGNTVIIQHKCTNIEGNDSVRNPIENNYDPFNGNAQIRYNVYFQLSTGKRVVLSVPINATVSQLLDGFFKKYGILNPELQCQINFVYNGKALKRFINGLPNNKKITDESINNGPTILVVDLKDILGA